MTLIYEKARKGPATHALVIGVSSPPDNPQLHPALRSADDLAQWLPTRFRNSTAELASVELLVSARPVLATALPSAFPDWPSVDTVLSAIQQWKERADSNTENIALFYFAGPGGPAALDTGLVLHDGPPSSKKTRTVSFLNIVAAMQACRAHRQVYFLDTNSSGYIGQTPRPLLPSLTGTDLPLPLERAIFYASAPTHIYGQPGQPTYFAAALLRALEAGKPAPTARAITVKRLAELINRELGRLRPGVSFRHFGSDITNDFELAFPPLGRSLPTGTGESVAELQAASAAGMARHDDEAGMSEGGGPAARPSGEPRPGAKAGDDLPRGGASKKKKQVRKKGGDSAARDEFPLAARAVETAAAEITEAALGPPGESAAPDEPPASADQDNSGPLSPEAQGLAPGEGFLPVGPDGSEVWSDVRAGEMFANYRDLDDPVTPAPPAQVSTSVRNDESNTDFIADDAETERDALGRSILAIGLARRLHRIWRSANEAPSPPAAEDERAAFVVHLDAPWGGGKTTFANFLARVLNPLAEGRPADFLSDRYGEADLGGIFLKDPPVDEAEADELAKVPPHSRRPWIVVPFNAWQAEHCAPPWWVFYQAIRKHCFRTIRREGDLAWRPPAPSPPGSWMARLGRLGRLGKRVLGRARGIDRWPVLVAREYAWRARNPKILSLFATAGFGGLMLLLLYWLGAWGPVEARGATTAGFVLTSGLGLLAAGLTGITGLWALAALFTESIVPGTNSLAERLSLGSGDPFERFRRHFYRTMADLRRPVMVIIDDLDRCRPDFVVDLVRGMQTLLRSPRVVFVILGDREWIERAFEVHHKAMEKVDVGPEQTFGARFVEKAIQMSFILPAMGDEARLAYVRRVLLGAAPKPGLQSAPGMDPGTAQTVREIVNRESAAPDSDPFDTERIVSRALDEVGSRPDSSIADEAALHRQVEQLVGETLAINATSSERVEQAVAHQLEALAQHFPANPRQIKRIVNAITVYYAVALQRPGLDPDETFRTQLALWIIMMTEWPETWRLLASFPSLVPILQSDDPLAAVVAEGADLPGSAEATTKVVGRIVADSDLVALIRGGASAPLDPKLVPLLAQLTPLHSRKRRLTDEKPAARDGEKVDAPG